VAACLRGISLFVIGSYPTHFTLAFSQLAQLGSLWSHRFFRSLQRLHALTFRKLELCPALPPGPLSWRDSPGGEGPVDEAGSKPDGDLASGGERRARFEGYCRVEDAGDFGFMTRYVSMWLSLARF
jgi:hypothetical protein